MKTNIQLIFIIAMLNMCFCHPLTEGQSSVIAEAVIWLVSLYTAEFKVNEPKISIIIKQDNKGLFRRFYGMADVDFGLGWYLEVLENEQVVSHGCGIFGVVCHTLYIPQHKIYIAALNNLIDPTRSPSTKALAKYGALWVLGKSDPFAQCKYLTLSPNQLKGFTGNYKFVEDTPGNIGKVRKMMQNDSHLYFGKNKILKIELLPVSEINFRSRVCWTL